MGAEHIPKGKLNKEMSKTYRKKIANVLKLDSMEKHKELLDRNTQYCQDNNPAQIKYKFYVVLIKSIPGQNSKVNLEGSSC